MATSCTFDITTGCDLQEVDNAVNQARKELTQRFDFKHVRFAIDFRRDAHLLVLAAPDAFKLRAIWEVLQAKLVRRAVPVQNLELGDPAPASGGSLRQEITLRQGIDAEVARQIVRAIKDRRLKRVQASVQGDQVRVAGPSRDDLQAVMALLRQGDYGVALQFGNYR